VVSVTVFSGLLVTLVIAGVIAFFIANKLQPQYSAKLSWMVGLTAGFVGSQYLSNVLSILFLGYFYFFQTQGDLSSLPADYLSAALGGAPLVAGLLMAPLAFGWLIYGYRRVRGRNHELEKPFKIAIGCLLVLIGLVVILLGSCAVILLGAGRF
jgi:NAD/NADP transhydrogenase beta subunit